MIVDVPTATDFQNHGAKFLNLAWDVVLRHADTMNAFDEIDEPDECERKEFAQSIADDVALALGLAHSGVDHLLKAGIATVSPYLLISSAPKEWPRGDKRSHEVAFADFRTIDSQDLVRVYNTVATERLPEAFVTQHDQLRRVRNRLIHTVDPRLSPAVKDLVLTILISTHTLVGPGSWVVMRRKGYDTAPSSKLMDLVGNTALVGGELLNVSDWLGASDLKRYLGIDKKRRFYKCPHCLSYSERDAWEHIQGIAQLASTEPDETTLRCVACGLDSIVKRAKCKQPGCRGNVLWPEWNDYCLTCDRYPY